MPVEKINFDAIESFIKNKISAKYVLNGLLAPIDLFLIKNIVNKGKKVLYITSDEQTAHKAQRDVENLLKLNSIVYPSQEIGFYSELEKNYYIYEEQVNAFLTRPDIVFMGVKALLEKFPSINFYKNNIIELKKNDTIDYSKIAQKLIELGYKRTVNV